ncbi:MAG: MBL fold metallo-hydrolase [Chloroflexi bacterium]|nr:MBL fold metallo-hydrolase [Chloroflexota bacterium]
MPIKTFTVGPMGNNTYVLYDETERVAAVVDPSMDSEEVLLWLAGQKLTTRYVINTHGHMDHVFHNGLFVKSTGAKLLIHRDDEPMLARLVEQAARMGVFRLDPSPSPDAYLEDGQELPVGSVTLKVIGTPGHTPGSSCLYIPGFVLTGDTLFQGSIGRFDFPGGSLPDLLASIKQKLFTLPDDTVVLPGHGPASTIAQEKRYNPFVGEQAPDPSEWAGGGL